jgi:hypothetical protein
MVLHQACENIEDWAFQAAVWASPLPWFFPRRLRQKWPLRQAKALSFLCLGDLDS